MRSVKNNMHNVLIVKYDLSVLGGGEQVSVKLANELSCINVYNVFLLSLNTSSDKIPYEIDSNVKFVKWRATGQKLFKTILIKKNSVVQFINNKNISLVIFIGLESSLLSVFIKRQCNSKIVSCDHSGLINQWKSKKDILCKWIQANKCDVFVVLNERTKNEYQNKFKIHPNKIEVIPNWIEDVNADLAYNIHSKNIVSIGRISKEKGYDMLVQVAEIVSDRHPEWHWDIYGDGPYRSTLEKEIFKRKLEQFITLKGNVQNAALLLNNYAMLILTSYRECFPLVLLEAKIHHLPAISFDINAGPNELIREGLDGFLIEPFNIDDMAKKIIVLIENDILRREMSDRAAENLNQFKKENVIISWKKLIKDTLLEESNER